jgi:acyl-coenzyme A thioesterase PaaI-like protein
VAVVALFEPDGDQFVPTTWSRGPWDPGFLHGGPVAMLAARALEALPSPIEMRIVRFTMEFMRPVPLAPLKVQTRQIRPGRRIQLVEVGIDSPDGEVVRAVGLKSRAPSSSPHGRGPGQT